RRRRRRGRRPRRNGCPSGVRAPAKLPWAGAVGRAERVDVHRLSWSGSALIARRPVVYALDTPARAHRDLRSALIVADPSTDHLAPLPHSRREAKLVENVLQKRGWKVQRWVGDDAKRTNIVAALPNTALFHFAGHAQAAAAVFGPALALTDEQRLTVADVLALPRSPDIALLSACETGAEESPRFGADLGVGQAFVLAGTRLAVATTRLVEDRTAAEVGQALHLAQAYDVRRAAEVIARHGPAAAAFRIYVP
ncbi:MAG: CHAT domain-containing protein, partial [Myxococcota bacterium]